MKPAREQSPSDTTLAKGQAALDGATRKTLCCASSETSLLGCLPGEGGHVISLRVKLGDTFYEQLLIIF